MMMRIDVGSSEVMRDPTEGAVEEVRGSSRSFSEYADYILLEYNKSLRFFHAQSMTLNESSIER